MLTLHSLEPAITNARRLRRALLLPALVVGLCVVSRPLPAQTSARDLTQAREGYRAGLALEAAENWSAALAKLQEVAAVKITPQVRFHIALCHDRLGKWTEALGGYRIAIAEARASNVTEVVEEAERALQALESRIPKIVVRLKAGSEAASVKLDGVSIGATSIGSPISVDPGGHLIEVALPGRAPRQVTVIAKEGTTEQVDIGVDEDAIARVEATPRAPTSRAGDRGVDAGPGRPGKGALPWIVLGTGGAALVASGVFYGLRASALSRLDDNCYDTVRCPTGEKDTYDKGRTYTLVANVALGVGAVGVGLGTVLLFTSGGKKSPSAARASAPSQSHLVVYPAGVSLQGTF